MSEFLLPDEEGRLRANAVTPEPANDFMLPGELPASERAANTLRRVIPINPEKAAEARRLAGLTSIPEPVVERNLEAAKTEGRLREIREAMRLDPILARQLTDPNFSKIAHDDIENLTNVSRGASGSWAVGASGDWHDSIGPSKGPQPGLRSIIEGLFKSFGQGAEGTRQGIRMQFADAMGFEDMSRDAGRKAAQNRFERELSTPAFETSTARGIYGGLSSVIAQTPGIAAAIALRSPSLALAPLGVQTEAEAYTKYRERGADPMMAGLGALGEGATEVLTEMIPMGFLVGKLGKVGAGEFLAGLLARELPTEQIATLVQDAIDTAVANPEKTWAQYAAERPGAAYETLVATVTQAGVMAGTGAAVRQLGMRQPEEAEQNAEAMTQLVQLAAASKVRERDPSSFEAFVNAAAEEGPVNNIHVNATMFMQAAGENIDALVAAMPSVAEQMGAAIATGGELVIPVGEFVAHAAEIAPSLIDHIRTAPDAMTRAEAKTFMQEQAETFQKDAEKILATEEFDTAFKESAASVERELLAQLKQANRFTDDVNTPYAKLAGAFYTVQAARLGITPEEMYVRYPLVISAEGLGGGATMDQRRRVADDFTPLTSGPFAGVSREQFLGNPKITTNANAADLKPKEITSLKDAPREPFATANAAKFGGNIGRYEAKYGPDGAAVFDGDKVIASYDFGDTLVVDKKYRRQGIGEELVYQWRTRNPTATPASSRTKASQALQAKVWERIKTEASRSLTQSPIPDTIAVDGTARPTVNSNGQRLGGSVAEIENFWRWFGDSKVVDAQGRPLVVYHGTQADVDQFNQDEPRSVASDDQGYFFTNDPEYASDHALFDWGRDNPQPNVMPVYLSIQNPIIEGNIGEPARWYDNNGAKIVENAIRLGSNDGLIVGGDNKLFVAFKNTQIKSAIGNRGTFDPGSANILEQTTKDQTKTKAFKAWSEGAPVYDPDELQDYEGGPAVFKLFHGTTGDFTAFDRERANPESDLGAGFYFTNTPEDVSENYAGEGPDLTNRIQMRAQRIASETDRDYGDPEVIAEAKEQLSVEHGGMAMPVFVKVKNPVVIGGDNETVLTYDSGYDEATDDYNEETGTLVDFVVALRNVASRYNDGSVDSAIDEMLSGGDSVRVSDVLKALKSSDDFSYYTDDNGDIASHEIIREAFEEAGFDGFVDFTVDEKFGSNRKIGKQMTGVNPDTVHVITFEPAQIKSSLGNDGTFDADDPNILSQPQQGGTRGQITFDDDITKSPSVITLLGNADLSTFVHELGHFQLEVLAHISAQPDAPAEIAADMDALLKWFEVPGADAKERLTNWQMLTLDEKRPMHEQLARGFEAYLFEGNSPSVELNGIFSRIRAWMINVYKQLTALNVTLTDEVRGVFDRLIATNEEILEAETQRGYTPLFKSAEEMGATDAEWQAYQELSREQTQEAVDQLQTRSLRDMRFTSNLRVRTMRKLQKQADTLRKGIEAEVEAEVRAQPVYAAQRFLRYGELPEADRTNAERKILDSFAGQVPKLSLPDLKAMYGEDPAAPWRYLPVGTNGIAATEGVHPDIIAPLFGFTSGDHLVRGILAAEPEASVIDAMTDQRMLERYGDLSSPDAIQRAADSAIHNEVRGRFIATELNALQKATGKARVLGKAAKAFAEAIVNRKKIREVRPAQYSAAEARAAKAAERAKSVVEKATEKRNQLVNHYAARAAHDAVAYVEKQLEYLKAVGTRESIDIAYRDQIDAMLERFDLRQVSNKAADKRARLAEWVKVQEEAGFEPTISDELRDEAFRKPYRELTVEEFRGLVDAVKNIEHIGRLKKKLLTAHDKREFDAAVDAIANTIADNAKNTRPEERASDRGFLVSARRLFDKAIAIHRKFASLVRGFDGYKDGGVAWDYLVRNMNERGNFEAAETEKATIALTKLLSPVMKAGKMTEKRYFPEIGKSFTREERIGIALNMGNEVNRERVLTGERLTPQQLDLILATLTKADWDFVQGVWNYFDTFREQIAAKERRISGTEPEWVEAAPVTTPFGEYKGGYYPIAYDPIRSERSSADINAEVQRQIQQGLYTRAQTRRGHTKARTESTGRALRYDFGQVITNHVTQVIHDLAWHEYLIDANRLLRAGRIEEAVKAHYGGEVLTELKDTLKDIAVGSMGAEKGAVFWNHLRYGTTIAGLGWNVFNSIQNFTGLTQSMSRIGSKWVMKGAVHWAGDAARFESAVTKMREKSALMRERGLGRTLTRDINDIRNKVQGSDSKLEAAFFWLQTKTQAVVDTPTWWGAYEKAMAQDDMTEDKAVALADQAVLDSQGGGQIKDLAGIQRGGAGMKLFTTFYSYFNLTFNLTAEAAGRTDFTKPKDLALFTADMVLLYSLPALLSTLLKAALMGDWDDEEKLAKKLIGDQISFALGTVVGLRELSAGTQAAFGVGEGFGYTGPASVRFFSDFYNLGKQVQQGELDEAFWKSLNNTAGVLFHYPSGQINRTATGIAALADGRTENPLALVMGAPRK